MRLPRSSPAASVPVVVLAEPESHLPTTSNPANPANVAHPVKLPRASPSSSALSAALVRRSSTGTTGTLTGSALQHQARQWATELLAAVHADEHPVWGGGAISPSPYETAWVARVRDPRRPERLAFPQALRALEQMQRADGGWGAGPAAYTILPTLAALVALHAAPRQTAALRARQARAHDYLARALPGWRVESLDTPFFEFLIPLLADELAAFGVNLTIPGMDVMLRRRDAKLERLPWRLLGDGASPLTHALEALGPRLGDPQIADLRAVRTPSGCYGCSPAATAAVLIYRSPWDDVAARWLRRLAGQAFGGIPGAMPTAHPADTFEAAWALHLLWQGGVTLDPAISQPLRETLFWLRRSLTADGAGFAANRALPPDADDTALALAMLNRLGVATSLAPLWRFMQDGRLLTYPGERTASTSANAHALEALLSVDAIGCDEALLVYRRRLVAYLLDARQDGAYWEDKWHISPVYATLASVFALTRLPDPAVHQSLAGTLNWLLETQRPDGSWRAIDDAAPDDDLTLARLASLIPGASSAPAYQPDETRSSYAEVIASSAGETTAGIDAVEETAYAVLALRALWRPLAPALAHRQARASGQALRRGVAYLARRAAAIRAGVGFLPMYVDKTLYQPYRVTQAAAYAALVGG
ncbi:MAG TPA: prenyltransferase/squalene oxidase repeat-containing protein [Ktedonobacterales bacterium]|nr:prenyltransferase/squalene oxidase repeat-containing protein [Ktedonobacterales bacterium]